ncbi:MAG: sel1 repeat family protein [Myxococcales bacterium]|nr:sel1 repeat family protein [Myxococcales bacterium]MCB9568357.1 sel1 repeat family protein [Myxococcales bacterium]MCB9705081.1 sel1 repeat family protein [Myxococcales bacterium]
MLYRSRVLRACALFALVAVGCHKSESTAPPPQEGCDGARCVEDAEAAIWEGKEDEAREPLTKVCEEQKDPFQCFRLGQLYHKGLGGPADPAKAAELYAMACDMGDEEACEARFEIAREGQGGDKVELEFSKKACEARRPRGCTNAADLMLTGRGVKADRNGAIEHYEKACGLGEAEACNSAGDLLYEAKDPYDQARALASYISGCVGNTGYGCLRVGVAFVEGIGTKPDLDKAAMNFRKACDFYNEDGCRNAKALEAAHGKPFTLELTSTVATIEAEGLKARDLSCQMDEQGAKALQAVLTDVAVTKGSLDNCVEEGRAVKISWSFAKGKVREAKVTGKTPKKEAACLIGVLKRVSLDETGSCNAILLVGDPEGAAKSLAALTGGDQSGEVRLSTKKQRANN